MKETESGEPVKFKIVQLVDRGMEHVVAAVEDKDKFLSREDAARIFLEIADLGTSGHWPDRVTPWVVGRAMNRLMSNNGAPDDYNLAELMRGFSGEESQRLVEESQTEE